MTQFAHPWRRATSPDAERMSDIDLVDELSRLAAIAASIAASMEHSDFSDGREVEGIRWISKEFSDDLAALSEAFSAEQTQRHQEAQK
jgi:hypothetical protein